MQGWDDYDIQPEQEEDKGGGWGGDISDDDPGIDQGFEPGFVATFEQQMHSSETNDCGALITKEPGKEDEYRKAMSQLDPIDRLKHLINSIVYSLNENNIISISSDERNDICRSIDNLSIVNIDAKYVSPLGYVLGYVGYNNNYMIEDRDSESVKKKKAVKLNKEVFNELDNINDVTGGIGNYGVYPADVVRYMRLWQKIKN